MTAPVRSWLLALLVVALMPLWVPILLVRLAVDVANASREVAMAFFTRIR